MKDRWIYKKVLFYFYRRALRCIVSPVRVDSLMKDAQRHYPAIVALAPDMGRRNPWNSSLYLVAITLSFHRAGLSESELEALFAALLHLAVIRRMMGCFNLAKSSHLYLFSLFIRRYIRWQDRHPESVDSAWKLERYGRERDRVHFEITHCPVVDYCAAYGDVSLCGIFCRGDFLTFRAVGGCLTRPHTIALGNRVCDYTVSGAEDRDSPP